MTEPTAPPTLPDTAALFLDFDGTLVPIAPRPQDVHVPPWVLPVLRVWQARLHGALAIVSGRPIAQLDAFLEPLRLCAAGAHGAEWRALPSGRIERFGVAPPPALVDAARRLAADHFGLLLELKASGCSLHYRARPELGHACGEALAAALAAEPGAALQWEWLHGQCVYELKQRAFSKGTAVAALLALPAFAGRVPVFVGDDVTDEDGIVAAQAAGGWGVSVGPGLSAAHFRLADPAAVGAWLGIVAGEALP
ncbi:MAG TPA: trehalose-phosphatase [Burkholderiaceae bacterium]|nr:trehalose-phosphatase [Burkholderiaceae bacterium]